MKKLFSLFLTTPLLFSCGTPSPTPSETPSASAVSSSEVDPYAEIEYALKIEGNAGDAAYDASKVELVPDHPLKGKTIYWLGSSVTYGSAASGNSMADYLAAKTGAICVKEAVSGTTIYDDGGTGDSGAKSYTRRLVNSTAFDPDAKIDAFICQISTNDCTSNRLIHRGSVAPDNVVDFEEFDRRTTLGGIEFIVSYVTETWNCPVYFYSGARFGDGADKAKRQNNNPKGSEYGKLVSETQQVCDKWTRLKYAKTGIIDLYNDDEFNEVATDEYYVWATSDPIHPKKAGYLQWWMPYFEHFLIHNI